MPSVNFEQLIQDWPQSLTLAELPAIWGGSFAADKLDRFLKAWELPKRNMPWRIWEWVSEIAFEHDTLPGNMDLLERGRAFGAGGDFSLRRDGKRFLWHFVGRTDAKLPAGFEWEKETSNEQADVFRVADYWSRYEGRTLQMRTRSALLWGKQQGGKTFWVEDRISGVKKALVYPQMSDYDRVQLCYREYLHGGNVEAVWWTELKGWEAKNG